MAIFLKCFSKFDDRSLDFICILARFYLDPMCEINSKRLDPPRSPQGYSLPKRTQRGVQPLNFISFQFQGRPVDSIFVRLGLWMLFLSYVRLGTSLIFGCSKGVRGGSGPSGKQPVETTISGVGPPQEQHTGIEYMRIWNSNGRCSSPVHGFFSR